MKWLWNTLVGYFILLLLLSLGTAAIIYWVWLAEAMKEVAQ